MAQLEAEFEMLNVYFENNHQYSIKDDNDSILGRVGGGSLMTIRNPYTDRCTGIRVLFAEDNQVRAIPFFSHSLDINDALLSVCSWSVLD